jgi:DNA polymerase V
MKEDSNINNIDPIKTVKVPTLISAYSCGFGTPFQDGYEYEEIHEKFVEGVDSPYIITATGDSMEPDIKHGDKLLTELISQPRHRDIVVAVLNGEMLVKQFFQNNYSCYLKPLNTKYPERKLQEEDACVFVARVKAIVYREI